MRSDSHGASSAISVPSVENNSSSTNDINHLKNPPPEKVCGEEGYSYLMDEYLRENCVGCHADGGFAEPPMAAGDISVAYQAALFIPKDKFIESVTENRLCGDCNLDAEGEVFKVLEEWIDSRFGECQN